MGTDEFPPIMRAARNPAQDVLSGDDTKRQRFDRAVERRQDHHATRFDQCGTGGDEQRAVGDMLDDFQRQHDIELPALRRQRLRRVTAIVDLEARLRGMNAGDIDILRRGVDPGNLGAEPRHRFGNQAAAATDIKQFKAVKRRQAAGTAEMPDQMIADKSDPRRIEAMQRPEIAFGIPPGIGNPAKLIDLIGVNRRVLGNETGRSH